MTVTLREGEPLLDALLRHHAAIGHDCGGALACSSCCVIVRDGALDPASEDELDMLDRAGASHPHARLACQTTGDGEVTIEFPESEASAAPKVEDISPVILSNEAASFLEKQLRKNENAVAVRLSVVPAGCSGFGYRMEPAEALRGDDSVFETGGVKIAVDPLSLPYVQGTRVDLVREGLARKLRFDNPNARTSCGCGESFGT